MMAYALVLGSTYAMVGAISSMDSAGKSAASTGGAAAATGNVNQGNVGMNNYNANKINSESMQTTGYGGHEVVGTDRRGQSKILEGRDGKPIFSNFQAANNEYNQGGVDIKRAGMSGANSTDVTSVSTPNVTASSVSQKTAADQQSYNTAASKTNTAANSFVSTLSNMTGSGSVKGTQNGTAVDASAGAQVINAEKSSMKRLAEKYHTNDATIAATLGFSPEAYGFGGKVNSTWSDTTGNKQAVTNDFARDVSKSQSFQSGIKTLQGVTDNTSLSNSASDLEAQSQSVNTAYASQTAAQKSLSESQNLSEAMSHNGVAAYLNHKTGEWKKEGLSNEQIRQKQDKFAYDFNQGIGNAQQEVAGYNSGQSGLTNKIATVKGLNAGFTNKVGQKLNAGGPQTVKSFYQSNKTLAGRYFNSGKYGEIKNKAQSLEQIAKLRKQDGGLKKIQSAVSSRLALASNVKASELSPNIVNDLQNSKWVSEHPAAVKAAENIIGNKTFRQHNPAGVAQYRALRNAGVLKPEDVVNNIPGLQKLQTKIGSQLSSNRVQIKKDSRIGQSIISKNIPNVPIKKPAMAAIKKNTTTGQTATNLTAVENTAVVVGAGALGGAFNPAEEDVVTGGVPTATETGSKIILPPNQWAK